MFFMKACPCGKGEALGLAVVAIEARPLDSKPFERADVLAPETPAALKCAGGSAAKSAASNAIPASHFKYARPA
jgi:hypothetical protein